MAEKSPAKPAVKLRGSLYDIKGDSIRLKNISCPKCGAGFLLANHKDRLVCGKCSYVEYKKRE